MVAEWITDAQLIGAQQRYHIATTKNKQQLIKAIEKATREEAAEKIKRDGLKAFMK